jgi:hypothetical protein
MLSSAPKNIFLGVGDATLHPFQGQVMPSPVPENGSISRARVKPSPTLKNIFLEIDRKLQ